MNNLSGGYIMVDLSSPNKVKQLAKAVALNKPLLVYYEDGTTEWGKVTVTYETVDDVEVPTYHITTANGFVTVEADGDASVRPLIVEGDGVPLEKEGVTITYCKWSLSGTHLMLVCAGNTAHGTKLTNNMLFATYSLPDFIINKISPIWMNDSVDIKQFWVRSISNESASLDNVQLRKENNNLTIYSTLAEELSGRRAFRFQFDLVIDNE